MYPVLAWTWADAGPLALAFLAAGATAYAGYRRGLFLAIVAVLTVLTGLGAGVALAPLTADGLTGFGLPADSLLPLCYFLILLITWVGVTIAAWCMCQEDDVRLTPVLDQVGGVLIGGIAGVMLAGTLLVGWSMVEPPPAARGASPPRMTLDLGARAVRVFARLVEPRAAGQELLLGGDAVRGQGAVGGDVVYATEPFDDVNGDRRHELGERFLDYDNDGRFTVNQAVTDHAHGRATVRDVGLLDRYWLSAWRRMRVLHPPRISSRLFVVIAKEAQAQERVYETAVDDPDEGETHRYSLKPDNDDDAGLLEIDATTGVVRFREQGIDPKLRKVRFTVMVEDRAGLTDEEKVEVTLRPPE